MYKAIHAGQDLNKCAEVCDAHDFAGINVTYDCAFAKRFNPFLGDLRAHPVSRSDINRAIFFDIDLGAGFLLQRADVLSAGTDQGADLIDRDLHRDDTWSM